MTKPLYPPFTEVDLTVASDIWDITPNGAAERAFAFKEVIEHSHWRDRHLYRRHPWCSRCELEYISDETGIRLCEPHQLKALRGRLLEVVSKDDLDAMRGFFDDNPTATESDPAAEAFVRSRFPKANDALVRGLIQYGAISFVYEEWSVDLSLSEVGERIATYLYLHGKPPADTYNPADDARTESRTYLTRDDLDELPEPEWLIPGILNRHAYAVLRGRDSSYKTFLALSWAASIASGQPWLGRPVVEGKVLYLAAEGAHGIGKRLTAWEYANQDGQRIPAEQLVITPQAVDLFAAGADLEAFLDRIEEDEYALVVIDTLNKCSGSADVNGSQANSILRSIERIKRATNGGSVLVLAHTGKTDDDVRGWSALEDDADIVWHAKAGDVITVNNTKMKDAASSDPLTLAISPVSFADSLVLEQADEDAVRQAELTASQAVLIDTLEEAFGDSGATSRQLLDASGLPKSTFYHALTAVKKSKAVIVEGKGDRARYRLSSNAVQSTPTTQSLTDSNQSNAVQSDVEVSVASLSKSNPPKGLDVGLTTLDEVSA